MARDQKDKDLHLYLDPITDEPGAHPVGTGLGGKAVAEAIKPTAEEADWRDQDAKVSGQIADNDDAIDTLNVLIESCRDGEYGFTASAEHVKAQDIKTLLMRHADECRVAAAELASQICQLGGEPDKGGSASGALHRGWVSVRSTLSGYSDLAILSECERGEDAALARYRKALKERMPSAIRALVEGQAQRTQRNHDRVKAMRDALQSAA